ncbi:MAG: lipid-A-disaccharide synthase N-terminal domain-containing protein [Planctomycetota bacterium]
MNRYTLACLALVSCVVGSAVTAKQASLSDGDASINLQGRVGDIDVVDGVDGLWVEHDGRTYSAEQYLALIRVQQDRRDAGGPVFHVLNITTATGVLWVGLGLLGQLLFTGRMVVQWLVSEKQRRSVVPPVFWYLSLAGATMLLAYFVWRKDIVGVLGQATGWAIYARNVFLIRRSGGEASGDDELRGSTAANP